MEKKKHESYETVISYNLCVVNYIFIVSNVSAEWDGNMKKEEKSIFSAYGQHDKPISKRVNGNELIVDFASRTWWTVYPWTGF